MKLSKVVTSPDGYQWYVGEAYNTDDHLALGGHETALEPILRSLIHPDKTYMNVGAHVGTWAIRMAKHCRGVYAIEANPLTAIALERNAHLNDLDEKISIWNMAAWDDDTTKFILVDENDKATGGSTRLQVWGIGPYFKAGHLALEQGYSTTRRLDGFGWADIGLISMDVEGAEAHVLRGARQTIEKYRPNLVIELHEGHPGVDDDLRAQVYEVLDELNYNYDSVFVAPPEEHIIATPIELELDEPETVKAGLLSSEDAGIVTEEDLLNTIVR